MFESMKAFFRRQKLSLYTFYYNLKLYPKTVLSLSLGIGAIAAFSLSFFYTWPALALFKYAFGMTGGMGAAQISALSAQYGSALSFWGTFGGAATASMLAINKATEFLVRFVRITNCVFLLRRANDQFYSNHRLALSDAKESIQRLLGRASFYKEILKTKTEKELLPNMQSASKIYEDKTLRDSLNKLIQKSVKIDDFKKALEDCIDTLAKKTMRTFIGFAFKGIPMTLGFERTVMNELIQLEHFELLKARYTELLEPIMEDYYQQYGKVHLGHDLIQKILTHQRLYHVPTPYETLNVPIYAKPAEIQKAYRKASLRAHPDHGGNAQAFQHLIKVRDLLLHPQLRENYNRQKRLDPQVVEMIDEASRHIDSPQKMIGWQQREAQGCEETQQSASQGPSAPRKGVRP